MPDANRHGTGAASALKSPTNVVAATSVQDASRAGTLQRRMQFRAANVRIAKAAKLAITDSAAYPASHDAPGSLGRATSTVATQTWANAMTG